MSPPKGSSGMQLNEYVQSESINMLSTSPQKQNNVKFVKENNNENQ